MADSFKFLTAHSFKNDITADLISELAIGRDLMHEDVHAVNTILFSLRLNNQLPFDWTAQEDGFLSTHDKSIWLDYIIYRYKMRVYPKIKFVSDFPVYLLIEPVSTCNLRCTMCFQVDKTFTRKPYMGLMNIDLYKRLIDEAVAGGTRALTLASRGEPTLHPKLNEMLAYASGKFFELKLNTNATKLTDDISNAILDAGVDELVFSVDSEDPEIYEKIRVGAKFDVVLNNIKRFHELRSQRPHSQTHTRISGVKLHSDQDDEKFAAFWGSIVDHVGTTPCEERWDTYSNKPHPELVKPCEYLWERAYVWFNGVMNPCDVDYKSMLSTGNVHNSTIKEIWHGDAYTRLREFHIGGKRSEFNPCDRCGVC